MVLEKNDKLICNKRVEDIRPYEYIGNHNISLQETKECILIVFPEEVTKEDIESFVKAVITQDFISNLKNNNLLLKCCKNNKFKEYNSIAEKIPEHDIEYIIPLTNRDEVKNFIIKKIV